ncbi:MAG: hypothetical protein H6R45_726 [Proteobacteria bacterium]|nr:hypothetical protein [Pseudomonadota bacterium]
MYETNIVRSGGETGAPNEAFGADGLRLVSWGELVARLGAARDFRRIMSDRIIAGGASFNLASARHLASRSEVKPGINPFALANGKIADGIGFADTGEGTAGDRGR